jgi:molybdenum cofactor biosynthesis protein B
METDERRFERYPEAASFAIVTVSDTLSRATDDIGAFVRDVLVREGHQVVAHSIVGEDVGAVRTAVQTLVHGSSLDVLITIGSTGLSTSDCVPEAIAPLLHKRISGFGELFRALSFQEIGPAAMFSRAFAGLMGHTAVFCLPGSRRAVELAVERLVLPDLGHLVMMLGFKPTLPPP